jgi:hypothetical protein
MFQQDGPSPKQFKHIPASNKAARFEGAKGSFIRVTDPGEKSLFDFDNGDAITIEAWVNPASAPKGGNVYILGKGRTSNPGQEANNQNWGLRLWDAGGFCGRVFSSAAARTAITRATGIAGRRRVASRQAAAGIMWR